ncbi:MAG: ATP-binding cassette domain-containing protein [Methylococcaceae bacterium]|nr:ATP-binding cassette domain-containing protein [Methylococcaceae bacterium]MDD1609425.1 ATP-binding cassette domain-containing protein [Methylococcaceae bacterium]
MKTDIKLRSSGETVENYSLAIHSTENSALTLKLEQVSKKFGELTVLENLNLAIESGTFVAIVGRSGCGKSTLLRLISGLDQPDQGDVFYDGKIHRVLNGHARVMFQEARLLPWRNVIDNVRLGLDKTGKDKALAALKHVGLESRAKEWPSVLSGGQRQRVALARALVHEPRLLLLDEPMGALDALTRIEMQQLIERIWLEDKFTAILVTHDISEAVMLADRVILLDGGKIDLDVNIDFPRPRQRDNAKLIELKEEILRRVLTTPDAAEAFSASE